jgi:isopenicillin-N epimerase
MNTLNASNNSRFGRHLRSQWYLETDLIYLNHGTVGATPKEVLDHQRDLVIAIERNPARFILRELTDNDGVRTDTRMRVAAARVAEFVGAQTKDIAPVDNITTGANAILRSFPFNTGDEILATSLGYGGVTNAATYVARSVGASLRTIDLPLPGATQETYLAQVINGLSNKTRMLIIDHITAQTALVLPIREIAAECRTRNIVVFVDGAHAPGNIPVDIPSLGVDFYAANLHKWAMAPRSCGLLWVTPERQKHVHAPITSWGLDNGLAAEFDAPGTRDPSAFLTAPFALDFLNRLGAAPGDTSEGIEVVMERNQSLAFATGQMLSAKWNTSFATPPSMIGSMVTVRLPPRLGKDAAAAGSVKTALMDQRIEIPVFSIEDELFIRVSVQVYCDASDMERLGDAVLSL